MKIKILTLTLLFFLAASIRPATADPSIAFSRDGTIFVAKGLEGIPQKKATGYDPEISPDGRFLAFTMYSGDGDRFIRVIDLSSGENISFPSIPGKNSYGPRWSPNGREILFNHWEETKADWTIATVKLGSGEFQHVFPDKTGLYSPFWSFDGNFVMAHDLDNIYRVDMATGKAMDTQPLSSITADSMPSSAIRFSASPDGKSWIFDGEVEGGKPWGKHRDPLISAVYVHSLETGATRRVTGDDICAAHPSWLPSGDEFLFSGYTPRDANKKGLPFSIYRQKISDKNFSLLISGGHDPSSSK